LKNTGFSFSQEIGYTLWKSDVHYHDHKITPFVLILCHSKNVRVFTLYLLKILFNVILLLKSKPSKWYQKPYVHFSLSRVTCHT